MANTIDINTSTPREVNITGKWTWHDYYNVTYNWTNAPTSLKSTVPESRIKLKSGTIVTVDSSYTNLTAKKDVDITWTESTISDTSRFWSSVCYGNGKFVTVAISNYFAYSTDGINWTEGTISSTSRDWYSVCYGNGKFVAVASSSNYFAYSNWYPDLDYIN